MPGPPRPKMHIDDLFSIIGEIKASIRRINRGMAKFDGGSIVITPTAANTPTSLAVSFTTKFDKIPIVQVTPSTTVPGTAVTGWAATAVTTTGFTAWVTRTATTATTLQWSATDGGQ